MISPARLIATPIPQRRPPRRPAETACRSAMKTFTSSLRRSLTRICRCQSDGSSSSVMKVWPPY